MRTPVIEIQNLTRDYGQGRGVFDLSFAVEPGKCSAFSGPTAQAKPQPSAT